MPIKQQTDDLFDLDAKQKSFSAIAFVGVELVPKTRQMALMNCLLHGMEGDDEGVIHQGNSLGKRVKKPPRADVILPTRHSVRPKGGNAAITRDDLTYKTNNKQLAFLQHIYRNLKAGGRAAVVLPITYYLKRVLAPMCAAI